MVSQIDPSGDEPMTNGHDGRATTFKALSEAAMEEVGTVHACLAELLHHFWLCFPVTTSELRQKVAAINESLIRYEKEVVAVCGARHGDVYVSFPLHGYTVHMLQL